MKTKVKPLEPNQYNTEPHDRGVRISRNKEKVWGEVYRVGTHSVIITTDKGPIRVQYENLLIAKLMDDGMVHPEENMIGEEGKALLDWENSLEQNLYSLN